MFCEDGSWFPINMENKREPKKVKDCKEGGRGLLQPFCQFHAWNRLSGPSQGGLPAYLPGGDVLIGHYFGLLWFPVVHFKKSKVFQIHHVIQKLSRKGGVHGCVPELKQKLWKRANPLVKWYLIQWWNEQGDVLGWRKSRTAIFFWGGRG